MAAKKGKRKRNRLVLVLLPALIFIFFMGWSMYWIGDKKRPQKMKTKTLEKDPVTFMPIVLEETQEVINA